ncbi:hypothetical protein LTR36_008361 [Oleoguttula mirabilis]|uniref:YMC020W-like alpha/beta hydrolase domain-containing protein n=1 Tax=Oleoguttula mirabilis TaxID=1507867 RepID=A0AAV9J8B1_9PEZI|nr:hypothetical protein LTR36_008361 [Oleoguttula mirabilis]
MAGDGAPVFKRKRDVAFAVWKAMAPARKRSKPNTDSPIQQQQPDPGQPSQPTQQHGDGDEPRPKPAPAPAPVNTTKVGLSGAAASARPGSWYGGGSWRAKASPVAQIARESISVAKGATSEASSESLRRPSQSVSKSMRGSRKSIPLAAEATRVHATSDTGDKSRPRFPSEEKPKGGDGANETEEAKEQPPVTVDEPAPLPPEPPLIELNKDAESVHSTDTAATGAQSGAWFGWWSRPDGYGSDGDRVKEGTKKIEIEAEEASNTPLPGTPTVESADATHDDTAGTGTATEADVRNDVPAVKAAQWEGLQPEMSVNTGSSRSWFGLWSSAQNQQAVEEVQVSEQPPEQAPPPEVTVTAEPAAAEDVLKTEVAGKKADKKEADERPSSSGWAFWSTERTKDTAPTPGETQKEIGELAVADTPSQSHPEAAQFNEQSEQQQHTKADGKRTNSLLRPKRGRAEQAKDSPIDSTASSAANSKTQTPSVSQIPTPADTPPRDDSEAPKAVQRGKQPQNRPNDILPTFRDTYPEAPSPGYVERLSAYLAQTLHITPPLAPPNHVYRVSPSPVRVKRAVALGIHGFFPAPLIQKVLGQPTGTSIRFANYAAASIKAWCHENQPDVKDVEIEKVALEGEGHVADRVDTLWKLLLNWLSHLRQADFILIACHSQGVPVAFMLVAKLIQLGCLSPNVRLSLCAMAGINLGPFLDYKSRLFGGSALELFDFCDSESKVSKSYVEALDICLRHGVRVTFIGSIDDQLVSLESSLYAPLSHPYVNRAVFIDGRLHAPNFLTHLVVFALKLRNLGISDHGLLRELSVPLAGSLVGGDGHSRVYDDPAVYRLAIDFALESTDVSHPPPNVPAPATAAASLLAQDKAKERSVNAARRASLLGYPPTLASANSIRRGSLSASSQLPGVAPVIAHYEPPQNGANVNPFYLPWAVRGMLGEDMVKIDEKLWSEVGELVKEFEEWRPTSKVLKDVRWRLEGVRSMV